MFCFVLFLKMALLLCQILKIQLPQIFQIGLHFFSWKGIDLSAYIIQKVIYAKPCNECTALFPPIHHVLQQKARCTSNRVELLITQSTQKLDNLSWYWKLVLILPAAQGHLMFWACPYPVWPVVKDWEDSENAKKYLVSLQLVYIQERFAAKSTNLNSILKHKAVTSTTIPF